MPGILKMNSSANGGLGARDVESKKRAYEGNMVNGNHALPNNISSAGAGAVRTPSYKGGDANGATPAINAMARPEPPGITHIGDEAYHSLSKLIQRISQETYNELSETLVQMRELKPPQPNGNLPNGLGLPNPHDAEANKQKKLLLLRFAHENRAKFIKLLVLTEWGRKASADLSKLIDLFGWAREQGVGQDRIDDQIDLMKRAMNDARQLNPDIKTALEILGTGKAEWIPDMGFIPPPPMSAEKSLKLLRYMNTSLSTRLIVHEKIPQQLSNWRIGDGRVTFVVDGQFEFDLMSFVEDSSDQFHFIDMRLLFSPAPVISADSRFFNRLKFGVDNLLREEGLEACFRYLHNITLSHKIFILSTQVNDLLQTGWSGSLRSEFAHRVLWIQYWLNRPGKKSWIEIGVASNKPKDGKISWRGPPIPSITVRWFREGVHVQDADLNFDWNHLSVERMIKRVIALHTAHLLKATQQIFSSNVVTQAAASDTDPSDCRLTISIGPKENTTTLSIEPITGRYTLSPATPFSTPAESVINRSLEPAVTSSTITQALARSVLDLVQRYAQQLGWKSVVRQALRMEVMKAAVNLDVLRFTLFWPRGWSTNVALATIVDATGESWWICEISEKGSTIAHAQKIAIGKVDGRPPPINRQTLSRIERVAVQQLSYSITTRALARDGKSYNLNFEICSPRRPASLESFIRGWALHVRTSELLPPRLGEDPWLRPEMQITGHGFRSDYRNVWHIATGSMRAEVAAVIKTLMSASPQTTFTFMEGGRFSILLSTPFGQEVVSELKARLRDLDRLRSFATTLEKRKMVLMSSSLEQVEFRYSRGLSVNVFFGKEKDIQVRFGDKNPHNRIRSFLTDIINERSLRVARSSHGGNIGLDRFCTCLIWSRPLMIALQALEDGTPVNIDNPAVRVHDLRTYRITYANPPCSFDIKLKPKDDRMLWSIEDNEGKAPDLRPKAERSPNFKRLDTLKAALHKLFRERSERWWGVHSGMVATMDGVPDALSRLNAAVIGCYVEGGVKLEDGIKVEGGEGNATTSASARPANNAATANRPARQAPPGRAGGNNHEIITID